MRPEPVTLINAFTVPLQELEQFLRRWKDNARIMAAETASGKTLEKGRANPEFQTSVQRLLNDPELHVTPRPAIYQVAVEVNPSDTL
jgi:hypothetical protein